MKHIQISAFESAGIKKNTINLPAKSTGFKYIKKDHTHIWRNQKIITFLTSKSSIIKEVHQISTFKSARIKHIEVSRNQINITRLTIKSAGIKQI
jgi:hypothetical protein